MSNFNNFNINIINSNYKFVVICEIGEIYIYKTNNDFKCILDNYLNDFELKMTDIKIFDKFGKNLNFENDNLNQIFIFSKKEINKNQIDKKFSDKIKNIIKNYKLDLNINKEILPDVYSNFELFKENEKILVKETFEKILEFFEHFKSIYNTLKLNFQISNEIINNFLLQKFSIDVFINNNNNNNNNEENIKEINKISNIISELENNFKEDVVIFDNLFLKYFEKIQRDFLNFKEYLNVILNKNEDDKNYNNIINNIIDLKTYYSNFDILEKLKKQIEDVNNYPIKFRKYLENFAYIVNETFLKLNNNNNNNITNNVIINNNNININNLKILYKRENNFTNKNYVKNINNNNNNNKSNVNFNNYKIENIENFYIKNSYNKINNKNLLNEYDNKIENLISNLINELNKNSENFDKLTFEFKNILNNSSKKNIHINNNNNNNNKNKTSLQINKIIYQFNEIKKTFFNQINYILSIKNNQILKLKNDKKLLNSNNLSDLIHINNLNINNECIFIPFKNGIYVCINFNEKNYPIYKFNYILDVNSFNDEIKNLINNKLLIIIGTISNINKINNNENNNNFFLKNEENFYYLVTLNKINYIIDYPNKNLNLKNYLFNFNLN